MWGSYELHSISKQTRNIAIDCEDKAHTATGVL